MRARTPSTRALRGLASLVVLPALVPALLLGACASESDVKVAVTGTDDACTPAETELDAGKVTFEFTNEAGDVSELYVLRADGSVVSEVENVPTNQRRTLTASLSAGEYRLTCKPGQKGDGFSSEIVVTGEGGEAAPAAGREIEVRAVDFAYEPATLTAKTGETVTFELENEGTVQHEMEVFDPEGEAIGEVGPTDVGAEGKVTLTLAEPGTYTLVCGIEGHAEQGMKGTLVVS